MTLLVIQAGRQAGSEPLSAMKPFQCHRRRQLCQKGSLLLLALLAGSALLPSPTLAFRQGRQTSRIAAPAAAAVQPESSRDAVDDWPRRRVHSPFNSEASMQIAARQRLFDYAVTEALDILAVVVEKVNIPEYKTTLEIPVIGGIDVTISNVNITSLEVRPAVGGCLQALSAHSRLARGAAYGIEPQHDPPVTLPRGVHMALSRLLSMMTSSNPAGGGHLFACCAVDTAAYHKH